MCLTLWWSTQPVTSLVFLVALHQCQCVCVCLVSWYYTSPKIVYIMSPQRDNYI